MFHIATTRFNNATFAENMAYRKKVLEPVLYGTSIRIYTKYSIGCTMFVFEMNNEENKIEGIGVIKNQVFHDKKYKIYSDSDYNRFIYRGSYWLSREQLLQIDPELIEIFDKMLFKGKSHLKRQSGITVVTEKLTKKWEQDLNGLKRRIKGIFVNIFKTKKTREDIILEEEDDEEKEEEEILLEEIKA
jgi:hypothetical protein